MNQEIQAYLDARDILNRAYFHTTGMPYVHGIVWHAIEYLERQVAPAFMAAVEEETVQS